MNKYLAVGVLMANCTLTLAMGLGADLLMSEMHYIQGVALTILCCCSVGVDAALVTYVGEQFR